MLGLAVWSHSRTRPLMEVARLLKTEAGMGLSPEARNGATRFPWKSMIRVLLVDDQVAVRSGLRMRLALEPDIAVVGEGDDGATALALAPALRPDVILMDIELPQMDGISATAALRDLVPSAAVVILSIHDGSATRARARAAGAADFVGKHEAGDRLPEAIRRAASGVVK